MEKTSLSLQKTTTTKDLIIDNLITLTENNLLQMLPTIASHLDPKTQTATIIALYKKVLEDGTDELKTQFFSKILETRIKTDNEYKKKIDEKTRNGKGQKKNEIEELKNEHKELYFKYEKLYKEMMTLYYKNKGF